MKGAGARVIVYISEPCEPELMYLLFDEIVLTREELLESVAAVESRHSVPEGGSL
jgi:hypothetical protein